MVKNDIGLSIGSDFVDYLSGSFFFQSASTPPGNWLTLRRAKQLYDDFPSKQKEVRQVLLRLEARIPPVFDFKDHIDLDVISGDIEQSDADREIRYMRENGAL